MAAVARGGAHKMPQVSQTQNSGQGPGVPYRIYYDLFVPD